MVCKTHGGHLLFSGGGDKPTDRLGAIEEGVMGMVMKVYELGHRGGTGRGSGKFSERETRSGSKLRRMKDRG
jgi:hypothetical protein